MVNIGGFDPGDYYFSSVPILPRIDFSQARAAYAEAIENSQDYHAEMGILSPQGTISFERLGKDEDYGVHRVGSVTKTFTTFLALKLAHDNVLPKGLKTQCGDLIAQDILAQVFEDPESAGKMTLEQLLSHTSGLELDDHSRPQDPQSAPTTLQERFLLEPTQGRKYTHPCRPGEGIGFYSNAGFAVAGWMMEAAYNQHHGKEIPFSQMMEKELFEGVFRLRESFIAPGPSRDVIQSPAGDMTTSTWDLMKVALRLQEGESSLEQAFGNGWQSNMLEARDLFKHHGLGCSANASVIQHAGLNREKLGSEERDVTAFVQFPLRPNEPGLVAMCDSSALGPKPQEQNFIKTLAMSAGIAQVEKAHQDPIYNLEFFCPPDAHLFHGNAYLATNVDPFAQEAPETIVCSRNGMKHELHRDANLDGKGIQGYRDENAAPWVFISKEDGRKIIYSDLCLLTRSINLDNLASKQPDSAYIKRLVGVYRDVDAPSEHPTYEFTEKNGRLYMREDKDKDSFPCLYIPDTDGGSWVVSNPTGRSIKFHFPENLKEGFLTITDILTGIRQLPYNSQKKTASLDPLNHSLQENILTNVQNRFTTNTSNEKFDTLTAKIRGCKGSQLEIKQLVTPILKDRNNEQANVRLLMTVAKALVGQGELVKASRIFYLIQLNLDSDEKLKETLEIGKSFLEYGEKHKDVLALDCAEFYISFMKGSKNVTLQQEGKALTQQLIHRLKEISKTDDKLVQEQASQLLDQIEIVELIGDLRNQPIYHLAQLEDLKNENSNIRKAFDIAERLQQNVDRAKIPFLFPQDKIIEIENGDKAVSIHVRLTGERQKPTDPVVIFEAGWGCSSSDWAFVHDQLPQNIQAISYDRAGMSWSSRVEVPTAERTIEHLEKILEVSKLKPPYIFVGHSAGGLTGQLFALKHPEAIKGLILVESSSETPYVNSSAASTPVLFDYFPKAAKHRFLHDYGGFLDERSGLTLQRIVMKSLHDETSKAEDREFMNTCQLLTTKLNASKQSQPYHCPVSIITKGLDQFDRDNGKVDSADFADWKEQQKRLALRSSSSENAHVIAEQSDHNVIYHEPEVIAKQIERIFKL